MGRADFGAARDWRSALAGCAGGSVVGIVARGIVARDAGLVGGRNLVRRSGCGGGFGAGDLVGETAGLVGASAGRAGVVAARVSMGCGEEKMRRRELRGVAMRVAEANALPVET